MVHRHYCAIISPVAPLGAEEWIGLYVEIFIDLYSYLMFDLLLLFAAVDWRIRHGENINRSFIDVNATAFRASFYD